VPRFTLTRGAGTAPNESSSQHACGSIPHSRSRHFSGSGGAIIRAARRASTSGLRAWHSHTTKVRHPAFLSARSWRRSRATLSANLAFQKDALLIGVVAYLHPRCRCQKHPCTNTAARCRAKTISGLPERDRECRRNRSPAACRARRTTISGLVFFPPMPAIMRLRVARSTISIRLRAGARLSRQSASPAPEERHSQLVDTGTFVARRRSSHWETSGAVPPHGP
jgi:hypothetical protein